MVLNVSNMKVIKSVNTTKSYTKTAILTFDQLLAGKQSIDSMQL